MKHIGLLFVILTLLTEGMSQSIRKPWREMTEDEKTSFVNALNAVSPSFVSNMANEHMRLAFEFGSNAHIHNSNVFLPWHRVFIHHLEEELKKVNPNISLPYWDWTDDWLSSAEIFDNLTILGQSGNDGLIGRNISASVWRDPRFTNSKFVRNFDNSESQPTQNQINNLVNMPQSDFTAFRETLEGGPHNTGHRLVGAGAGSPGTMATMFSPADPVFYLHHCMVDKVWHDWVETNWTGTTLSFSSNDPNGGNTSMLTFIGYAGSTNENNVVRVNPNSWVDSRSSKVWYADNEEVLLDDYTTSGTENYRYTGTIVMEDFTVNSTTTVKAGQKISLKDGFRVRSGRSFRAEIGSSMFNVPGARISSSEGHEKGIDNGQATLSQTGVQYLEQAEGKNVYGMDIPGKWESQLEKNISIYPNPSFGEFAIEFGSSRDDWKVRVLNVMGKAVSFQSNLFHDKILHVKLDHASPGVYCVIFESAHGKKYLKKVTISK